jgi:tripartite-type tricarboxylate transporter receptor subunit TctC
MVARNALPADDLKSLVAWLKANPEKASMGTQGVGGAGHVGGVFFQKITGTRFQFVPYRGAAPTMQALLGGHVDMMIDNPSSSLPQLRASTIKAYAIMARSRLAASPNIPTVDEAGLPELYFSGWFGIFAPKSTSKNIIDRLNAAAMESLADANVRVRLGDLGQEIPPRDEQTPEALRADHKAEIEKWWPIINAANIKGE